MIPEMKTLDGHIISNGMIVWDYDLDLVTIDLWKMEDPNIGKYYNQPDPLGQYWFEVVKPSGSKRLMSNTRVWLYHPHTNKKAEK